MEVPESAYGNIGQEEVVVATKEITRGRTEELVREYFSDIPVMAEVARCESTFRHTLADGSVLRGVVDNRDTGVMQINTYYHQATADALELDLEDFYHNMAFARDLYERQGTQPWSASKPCWGKSVLAMAN
jgi:hypothetical protein